MKTKLTFLLSRSVLGIALAITLVQLNANLLFAEAENGGSSARIGDSEHCRSVIAETGETAETLGSIANPLLLAIDSNGWLQLGSSNQDRLRRSVKGIMLYSNLILPDNYNFDPSLPLNKQTSEDLLRDLQRLQQDIASPKLQSFIDSLKNFMVGNLDLTEMKTAILKFSNYLYALVKSKHLAENPITRTSILSALMEFRPYFRSAIRPRLSEEELVKYYQLKRYDFASKISKADTTLYGTEGLPLSREVFGEYVGGQDVFLQMVIESLQQAGGKLLGMHGVDEQGHVYQNINPTFIVSDDGTPNIYINLNSNHAITSLAHEYKHFINWKIKRDEILGRELITNKGAALKARDYFLQAENKIRDEESALIEEERALVDLADSPFAGSDFDQARSGQDLYYYVNQNYPINEGVRRLLSDFLHFHKNLNLKYIKALLKENIQRTLRARKKIYDYYLGDLQQRQENPNSKRYEWRQEYSKHYMNYMERLPLFEFIFFYDQDRFAADTSLTILKDLFLQVVNENSFESLKFNKHDQISFMKAEDLAVRDRGNHERYRKISAEYSHKDKTTIKYYVLYLQDIKKTIAEKHSLDKFTSGQLVKRHIDIIALLGMNSYLFIESINNFIEKKMDEESFLREIDEILAELSSVTFATATR